MQTTREKLTVLTKRVIAAQNALKLSDKLKVKANVRMAEAAALEASLMVCPDGQTKAGLTKRFKTIGDSVKRLVSDIEAAKKTAANAIDLNCPFIVEITDIPAETGTEGGESV